MEFPVKFIESKLSKSFFLFKSKTLSFKLLIKKIVLYILSSLIITFLNLTNFSIYSSFFRNP